MSLVGLPEAEWLAQVAAAQAQADAVAAALAAAARAHARGGGGAAARAARRLGPRMVGLVGNANLARGAALAADLDALSAAAPLLRGVRPYPVADWADAGPPRAALAAADARGLAVDVLLASRDAVGALDAVAAARTTVTLRASRG